MLHVTCYMLQVTRYMLRVTCDVIQGSQQKSLFRVIFRFLMVCSEQACCRLTLKKCWTKTIALISIESATSALSVVSRTEYSKVTINSRILIGEGNHCQLNLNFCDLNISQDSLYQFYSHQLESCTGLWQLASGRYNWLDMVSNIDAISNVTYSE